LKKANEERKSRIPILKKENGSLALPDGPHDHFRRKGQSGARQERPIPVARIVYEHFSAFTHPSEPAYSGLQNAVV
jgi:hypothetical protein